MPVEMNGHRTYIGLLSSLVAIHIYPDLSISFGGRDSDRFEGLKGERFDTLGQSYNSDH
jgi:hypothetical protein